MTTFKLKFECGYGKNSLNKQIKQEKNKQSKL